LPLHAFVSSAYLKLLAILVLIASSITIKDVFS